MPMKCLLIDDEADKGWSRVLEKIIQKRYNDVDFVSVTEESQIEGKINYFWDLIFLDLRFGEKDHTATEVKEYVGYRTLKKIRDFSNPNFPTPVIIFSATTRIWNIDELMNEGADDYFIKESPVYILDKEYSEKNYQRLLNIIRKSEWLLNRRYQTWDKILSIKAASQNNIKNANVKERIWEKLRIGYGLLIRQITDFESRELLFNQEALAFMVFWSILEEISKDWYARNWDDSDDHNWKIRGTNDYLVEDLVTGINEGFIRVGIDKRKGDKLYQREVNVIYPGQKSFNEWYYNFRLNLSKQIYGLLLIKLGWSSEKAQQEFKPLNDYRNKIDFIHSSTNAIFYKTIKSSYDTREAFVKCKKMLSFIEEMLATE